MTGLRRMEDWSGDRRREEVAEDGIRMRMVVGRGGVECRWLLLVEVVVRMGMGMDMDMDMDRLLGRRGICHRPRME